MDKELKDDWTAALRSGKFKQGKDALACKTSPNEYSYCCLGVLAEVLELPWKERFDTKYYTTGEFPSCSQLSITEYNRIGLTPHDARELMEMNDGGCTFEEIAEVIDGL